MKIIIYLNGDSVEGNFYIEEHKKRFEAGDKIICANGGYDLANSIGVKPDIVIGDLDSKMMDIPSDIELIKYPSAKNFSDFELAVEYSIKLKPEKIIVFGALGGRKDHEVINLVVLAYTNIPMVFVEREIEVYNVKGKLTIKNSKNKICSLVSLSTGTIVKNLDGFKYEMIDEELKPSSRGLSNIITSDNAKIELEGEAVLFFLNK